ncbi:MAG: DUF3107 family protein [Solirubrobacterales bacterium]|nr:DUF3107 family protein [Solirubrobacterales bacterium]
MAEREGKSKIVFAGGVTIEVKGSADQIQREISRSRAADLAKFTKANGHQVVVYVVAANVAYIEEVPEDRSDVGFA